MKKHMKLFVMMIAAVLFLAVGAMQAQAADTVLKDGKWASGELTETSGNQYYKINIKKTGYIKADYKDADTTYGDLVICDKNKKQIQEAVPIDSETTSYTAVKKGVYYLCIVGSVWDHMQEELETAKYNVKYRVKYTFTAMNAAKNPTSIKQAETLQKNKQVSGLVFPSAKRENAFYKITLSKKSKVKFKWDINKSYNVIFSLMLKIMDKKGDFLAFKGEKIIKDEDYISWWEKKGSDTVVLPKGTYYFVIRSLPGYSGYYKLQLQSITPL